MAHRRYSIADKWDSLATRVMSNCEVKNLKVLLVSVMAIAWFAPCNGLADPSGQLSTKSECDAGNLRASAPSDGYGLFAAGRYCDGLVVEEHSALSLQIVSFSMATEPLGAAKMLVLRTPVVPDKGAQMLRGRNVTGAAAYRFDARVRDGSAFELNLARVALKYNIDAAAMAFVGEAQIDGAQYLTPVAIGITRGEHPWPKKYLLTLRLSSPAASIAYTLLTLNGGGVVAKGKIKGPIAADDLVKILIDASKPGAFRLNLEVHGVEQDGSAGPIAFTHRIYTGSAK